MEKRERKVPDTFNRAQVVDLFIHSPDCPYSIRTVIVICVTTKEFEPEFSRIVHVRSSEVLESHVNE